MNKHPKNKTNIFAKWFGFGLMTIGAAVLLLLASGITSNKAQHAERLEAFETMKAEAAIVNETQKPIEIKNSSSKETTNQQLSGVEGVLAIPQIDLKAPVLLGADEQTLAQGLGAIENMDAPGEIDGSYAIAGHQSYVFGQYFNRLHELKEGQKFTFETVDGVQNYEVFAVQIVKPERVDVLDQQEDIALLSLITCYPERSNEFRLIVQAKRIK